VRLFTAESQKTNRTITRSLPADQPMRCAVNESNWRGPNGATRGVSYSVRLGLAAHRLKDFEIYCWKGAIWYILLLMDRKKKRYLVSPFATMISDKIVSI